MGTMRCAALILLVVPCLAEPRLLLTRGDIVRPTRHVCEFGLAGWAIPNEGSGWPHKYLCPEHGIRLTQKQRLNLWPLDGKESSPGVFQVTLTGAHDQISVAPGNFSFDRTESRN